MIYDKEAPMNEPRVEQGQGQTDFGVNTVE